jgi:hypothetical protein
VRDDQPTEQERRALAAWTPAEPPPGFADRVVAAARPTSVGDGPDLSGALPRLAVRWPRVAAAAIALTALAGTVAATLHYGLPSTSSQPVEAPADAVSDDPFDPGDAIDVKRPDANKKKTAANTLEIPADLGARLGAHVGSYGAEYGPAFAFRGSLVVARDGAVVYAGHFGATADADGAAIGEHTRFKIG